MVLTRFNQALERYKADMGYSTYWRYKGGRLPQLLAWLAQRPDLAVALAEDSVELAQQHTEPADDTTAAQMAL